jgi:nucleotide-binding universal stress UspA family protein
MYEQLLVTLDGSAASETAIEEALRLTQGTEARVLLCRVAELPEGTAQTPEPSRVPASYAAGGVKDVIGQKVYEDRGQAISRVKDEVATYLATKARLFADAGVKVDTEVLFGEPVEEILQLANSRDVDVIVMATHGRTGLAQVVFGSVATRIVGSGVRPVLLVRPTALH